MEEVERICLYIYSIVNQQLLLNLPAEKFPVPTILTPLSPSSLGKLLFLGTLGHWPSHCFPGLPAIQSSTHTAAQGIHSTKI